MIFHPTLTIHNLYHLETTITVAQFKIGPYAEIRYSYAGWLCFNVGWKTDQITITFAFATTLMDCYKNLIEAFYCDWSNWVGTTAKYFDSCAASSS